VSEFTGNLKDFQNDTLNFCLTHPYSLMNLDPGLGKTITSLALACKVGGRVLVICPAFLKRNWAREIEKFTRNLDVTLTSYASLKKITDFNTYSTIILDEVHAVKNKDAKRTLLVHELVSKHKPKYLVGLTGTVVSNRLSDFFSLLQLCYHGGKYPEFRPFYKLYYKFCHRFSYERTIDLGHVTIVRFDGLRMTRIKELQALIRPVLIRKKADQVLDLPEEIESDYVGNSKKYDNDLKEALDLFKADPNDPQYMSLKSANALAKVETTLKLAKELIDQGIRPLIFTCHVAAADLLSEKLGCKKIDGTIHPDKRQPIIDEFNSGKPVALVATIKSTAVGFNITSTNYTIFNDIDFSPDNITQAKKRTLRMGQNKTCFYYYIFTSEFDKSLRDMVTRKGKDINNIFKGF
jgi:SNF2 family DNA or RNA helicase